MKLRFRFSSARSGVAFTILELMLSIGIFALILTAIYSIWIAILKGTRVGQKAAAEVQRARVTLRTVEDALNGAQFYAGNARYYYFKADTSGDFASVEFSARLPDSFLGSEQYKQLQQKIRRVKFDVQAGKNGEMDLMLTQWPILLPDKPVNSGYEPYSITLAKDVTHFQLAFFDLQKGEWLDEWIYTNRLPRIVQVAVGLGRSASNSRKPSELVYSLIALPTDALPVGGDLQGGQAGMQTGEMPPGSLPPGSQIPPGRGPGAIPRK